ncbi:hypothetical protein [Plantactinospora soyae]|uniref:Uncharacterized protein n=1 Tax=Plantactinospora soyae TaxID=1544732 RepID=A0A927MBC5_9ACTN|nr:hypothetical protein [Plantactinospora soyae]MBE1490460.1 hypothetical protein [Plantactinospora soyae]
MTDHWGGWPEDQPDFDGPDGGEFDDLGQDQSEGDDYPVEGFGAADAAPDDLTGAADPPPEPIGYDGLGAGSPRFDPYPEADPYADGAAGIGPDDSTEVPAEVGMGPADPPIGADPDLDPYGDTAQWSEPAWSAPDASDLGPPPEPVDGFPWADPALLGDPAAAPVEPTAAGPAPGPEELADYAGTELPADGDPWTALADSEDPATSALARFWSPDNR